MKTFVSVLVCHVNSTLDTLSLPLMFSDVGLSPKTLKNVSVFFFLSIGTKNSEGH